MYTTKIFLLYFVINVLHPPTKAFVSSMKLKVQQQLGSPVPLPRIYQPSSDVFTIDRNIDISSNQKGCDILDHAIRRFYVSVFYGTTMVTNKEVVGSSINEKILKTCQIFISAVCNETSNGKIWPSNSMNESYILDISSQGIALKSSEVWGAIRGLETLGQLTFKDAGNKLLMNKTHIEDYPRFAFRGLLLDTSRHYISKSMLLENLEAMAMSKYNVFHWHIVDDPSFPYQSRTFPSLSKKGAFNPYTHVYTQDDIADVMEYGRRLGIRVVPEFDTPGHTQSWGPGAPGLLTPCYSGGKPNGRYGPVDPSNNLTYTFMEGMFGEITRVFPEKYLHLGGDEVNFDCWKSNPAITAFMKKMGFPGNYAKLEEYYMNRLIQLIGKVKPVTKQQKFVVWQEVLDNNVKLPSDTIVHVWKGETAWAGEMSHVTQKGFNALLSSCWYLNYVHYGVDWQPYYKCDPQDFTGTPQQKERVIGGAACMWGEYVDDTNLISRLWPRASVVGERLWSDASVKSAAAFAPRLEAHRCRMIKRGIRAESANGPGFCFTEGEASWGRDRL